MTEALSDLELNARLAYPFGIEPYLAAKLLAVFDTTAELESAWIFGSRARGDARAESDIDLAVDAPTMSAEQFSALLSRIDDLGLIYGLDVVHLQRIKDSTFRANIERERKVFWEPRRYATSPETIGSTQLKTRM